MLVGNELVVLAAQILLDYSSLVASIQRKLVLLNIKKKKKKNLYRPFISKNGRMPGGAGRRTSTSFEAINASSATGISNLVRYGV